MDPIRRARGGGGQVAEERVGRIGYQDRQRAERGRPGSEPDRLVGVATPRAEATERRGVNVDPAMPAMPVDEAEPALQEPASPARRPLLGRDPAGAGQAIDRVRHRRVGNEDGHVARKRLPGRREPFGMQGAALEQDEPDAGTCQAMQPVDRQAEADLGHRPLLLGEALDPRSKRRSWIELADAFRRTPRSAASPAATEIRSCGSPSIGSTPAPLALAARARPGGAG